MFVFINYLSQTQPINGVIMAKNPRYLLTESGHVWVVCKKCQEAIPVWQADDDGEKTTFTCPWCRKETLKGEKKLPVPAFKNAPQFKQPSLQPNYKKLNEGDYQWVEVAKLNVVTLPTSEQQMKVWAAEANAATAAAEDAQ